MTYLHVWVHTWVMPPRGTTLRNVRIDDELWSAAKAKATAEERTVSEVVRELLASWVGQP